MPFIKTDVDSKRAMKKLKRAKKELDRGVGSAILNVGRMIKNKARLLAPRDTGRTIQNIILKNKGQGRDTVQIVSQNSTPNARKQGQVFHLPRWMHESPRAKDHIDTGHHNYMDLAREYGEDIAADIVEDEVTKTTAKLN